MITIRAAVEEDLPLIEEFIRGLAEYEKLADTLTLSRESLRDHLFVKQYARVLLAFEDEEAAGFAVYFFTYSTFLTKPVLYLEDVFVPPGKRGRGIGSRLFDELIRVANERGCGRFEWSVLDWNQSGIDFYEKLGAKAQSEWVRYRLEEEQIRELRSRGGGG